MNKTTEQLEALASLLDLEEFEVLEASEDRLGKRRAFVLAPRVLIGLCPHCGAVCEERHACHDRQVHDLPLGAYATQLIVRLFQYRCRHCDKFFTPRLGALAEGAHATERFLQRLAELVKHTDLANAAGFLGVAPKTLEHWYYDYLKRRERGEQNLGPVRSLGIDELSLKKDTANSVSS